MFQKKTIAAAAPASDPGLRPGVAPAASLGGGKKFGGAKKFGKGGFSKGGGVSSFSGGKR